jgi:hypothetical protein
MQERIYWIDGCLLKPKTVLDSKEPKVHIDDLAKTKAWLVE